jgi:hypothetical protein
MLNQLQRGDEPAFLPCRCSGFFKRPEEAADRRTAIRGVALPRPAAQQPACSSACRPGIAIRRCPAVGIVPRIQTLFPDTAVHVMQTPGVPRQPP